MKVALSAQVLSDSVAKSLRLANEIQISGFEDCLATARFIEV